MEHDALYGPTSEFDCRVTYPQARDKLDYEDVQSLHALVPRN